MNFLTAEVEIRPDLKTLRRGLAKAKGIVRTAATGIQRILNKISFKRMAIAAAAAAVAVGYALKRIIDVAGDAIEIQGKFNVVFGKFAKQATAWAKTFGQAVGRARQDVKRWMSGIQDILVPMGFARRDAFKLSKAIVKLAIDVGSFSNVASEDVLRDFTSALVGNHETVRKYGIMIDEATLKQAALAMGLNKTAKQLTAAEKLQARYNIIIASSSDANTDATRTANEYANQLQRMWGNIKNVAETIGASMIGDARSGLIGLNKWLEKNEVKWGQWAQAAVIQVRYFAGELKNFWQNTDFKGKWETMLDSILILLKGFVKAAIVLAIAAGKGMWKGIREGIGGGNGIERRANQLFRQRGGTFDTEVSIFGPASGPRAPKFSEGFTGEEVLSISLRQAKREYAQGIIGPAFKQVGDIMVRAAKDVRDRMHGELSGAGKAESARLKAVRDAALATIGDAALPSGAWLGHPNRLDRVTETLTQTPGQGAFKATKDIEKFGKKIVDMLKTPQQKFDEFNDMLSDAIRVGLIDVEQREKALALGRKQIFGATKTKEGEGGHAEFGGLMNLAALALGGKTDPALEESRKQGQTLKSIEENTRTQGPVLGN